jgi:hypothetical protein
VRPPRRERAATTMLAEPDSADMVEAIRAIDRHP